MIKCCAVGYVLVFSLENVKSLTVRRDRQMFSVWRCLSASSYESTDVIVCDNSLFISRLSIIWSLWIKKTSPGFSNVNTPTLVRLFVFSAPNICWDVKCLFSAISYNANYSQHKKTSGSRRTFLLCFMFYNTLSNFGCPYIIFKNINRFTTRCSCRMEHLNILCVTES